MEKERKKEHKTTYPLSCLVELDRLLRGNLTLNINIYLLVNTAKYLELRRRRWKVIFTRSMIILCDTVTGPL